MRRLVLLSAFSTLAACQCTDLTTSTRFTCTTDDDCASGFHCVDQGQGKECSTSTATGGGSATGGGGGGGGAPLGGGGAVDGGGAGGGMAGGGGGGGVDPDAGLDAGADDAGTDDAGLDASVDAGFDAGFDAGIDAGPSGADPFSLVFVTAEQTTLPNTCSQIMVLETRDDAGLLTAVKADEPLALTFDGGLDASVNFYAGSGCQGMATPSLLMPQGASSTSFSTRATAPGVFTLRATSSTVGSASQLFTVLRPPDSLAFTIRPTGTVRAGECLPITLEARAAGAPIQLTTRATIGLTVSPAGAGRFASDSQCNTSVTTAQIQAGTSSTSLFFMPLTGAVTQTVTGTAPFGTASFSVAVTSMVRVSRCDFGPHVYAVDGGLPDGGTGPDTFTTVRTCTISPALTDLTASVLLQQSIGTITGGEWGASLARCHIVNTTSVQCIRRQDQDPASVLLQIAEIPTGVLVQRSSSSTTATTCTANGLTTPVDLGKSFVLKAVSYPEGNFDDEESNKVELINPTTVTVTPALCQGLDVQVVQWDGVTVVRSNGPDGGLPGTVTSATVTGLASSGMRGLVLSQSATTATGTRPLCSTMVRAAMASPTSVQLTRTNGDAGCPVSPLEYVHFERIDFQNEASVNAYDFRLAPGELTKTFPISAVDATRTLVFSSSQTASGQGSGETDFGGSAGHDEATAQLALETSGMGQVVRVTRGAGTSATRFTVYVVELTP